MADIYYTTYPIIYASNAEPLIVSGLPAGGHCQCTLANRDISVPVTFAADRRGVLSLPIKDIANSMARDSIFHLDAVDRAISVGDNLTIQIPDRSLIRLTLSPGGVDDKCIPALPRGCFITYRPQVCITHPHGKELLALLVSDTAPVSSQPGILKSSAPIAEEGPSIAPRVVTSHFERVYVKLYLEGEHPEDVDDAGHKKWDLKLFHSGSIPQGITASALIDVSYNKIRGLVNTNRRLLAYDIYIPSSSTVQRFVVDYNTNSAVFVYRNSVGAYDTVYAHGSETRQLDQEFTMFVTNSDERELNNDTKENWTLSSGNLISDRQIDMWHDFLRSPERFIFEDGELKPIIIESSESPTERGKLSSIQFTYRLSTRPSGRYYENKPLNKFHI